MSRAARVTRGMSAPVGERPAKVLKEELPPRSQYSQHQPAQTPLAAQNVRQRRPIITGPIAMLAVGGLAAAPVASQAASTMPMLTVAIVALAIGTVWLAAQAAEARRNSDRDRIRGEAALRQQLADVLVKVDDVLAGQAAITIRFLAVVDDVRRDVRVSRQPKTAPQRRRRRKPTAPTPTFDEIVDGSNVIQMPRPETVALVDRIIRRSINGAVKFPDGLDR